MSQLRSLFLEVVGACFAQRALIEGQKVGSSAGEILAKIDYCLFEMLLLTQEGERFVPREYSDAMLATVSEDPESDATWEAFGTYCYFQCMVSILSEFPELLNRFWLMGLGEWAELEADRDTLYPFAFRIIRGVEEAVKREGDLPQDEPVEAAELIGQISELFEIPLSRKLQELVDLYLADYSGGDDCFGLWPGEMLQ
jgi:hypothetical protein